jgi:hypothetical protein
MKRNDDFIRKLVLEAEASDDIYLMALMSLGPNSEELNRHFHAELLCDAGFFEAVSDGIYRMTNQGHDYAQVIQSNEIWEKTKSSVAILGGATLGMMMDLAVGYVKQHAAEKLGIAL